MTDTNANYLSVCLVCLIVYLFFCLSIYLSACVLSVCACTCLHFCLSSSLSLCVSAFMSQSVILSVCLLVGMQFPIRYCVSLLGK